MQRMREESGNARIGMPQWRLKVRNTKMDDETNKCADIVSAIPRDHLKSDGNLFEAKLNDNERLAIITLDKIGVRRDVIATAFGVNRRTVAHMVNETSPRYRASRKKYYAEGHDNCVAKYITEEVLRKVRDVPVRTKTNTPPKTDEVVVSSRADRLAGSHRIDPMPPLRRYAREVEIKFLRDTDDPDKPDGWYYRDKSSTTDPDSWFSFGEESRKTSSACLRAVAENLMDT